MTPIQIKIAAWGGLALLAWLCTRARNVAADVTLGVGTIDGEFGRDYYYIPRPSTLPAPVPPMNAVTEAIERSNAALARDRAENPELYE